MIDEEEDEKQPRRKLNKLGPGIKISMECQDKQHVINISDAGELSFSHHTIGELRAYSCMRVLGADDKCRCSLFLENWKYGKGPYSSVVPQSIRGVRPHGQHAERAFRLWRRYRAKNRDLAINVPSFSYNPSVSKDDVLVELTNDLTDLFNREGLWTKLESTLSIEPSVPGSYVKTTKVGLSAKKASDVFVSFDVRDDNKIAVSSYIHGLTYKRVLSDDNATAVIDLIGNQLFLKQLGDTSDRNIESTTASNEEAEITRAVKKAGMSSYINSVSVNSGSGKLSFAVDLDRKHVEAVPRLVRLFGRWKKAADQLKGYSDREHRVPKKDE